MEIDRESEAKFTFSNGSVEGGTMVVHLGGEVDLSNIDLLRPNLEESLAEGPDRLIVDLSELSFFDSSGIALLVEFSEKVPTLQLRNPSALIERIVQATGLTEVLKIES